jgi:hypothetical protein
MVVAKLYQEKFELLDAEIDERLPVITDGLVVHYPFDGSLNHKIIIDNLDLNILSYNSHATTWQMKNDLANGSIATGTITTNDSATQEQALTYDLVVSDMYVWGNSVINTLKTWAEAGAVVWATGNDTSTNNLVLSTELIGTETNTHGYIYDDIRLEAYLGRNTANIQVDNTSNDPNYYIETLHQDCIPLYYHSMSTGSEMIMGYLYLPNNDNGGSLFFDEFGPVTGFANNRVWLKKLLEFQLGIAKNTITDVSTTKTFDGVSIEEDTINTVPTPTINSLPTYGNSWGTFNINQYNDNNDFSIGTISSVVDNIITIVPDHVIRTYDVLNPYTTGGGVTAGTDYFIKKLSDTQFTLHAYNSSQDGSQGYYVYNPLNDGSRGFAVYSSIYSDERIAVNETDFPTMWHGAPHRPNSGIVKEVIPNGYKGIHDCLRLHTHRPDNVIDYMAYDVNPDVRIGTNSVSFKVRRAQGNNSAVSAYVRTWISGESSNSSTFSITDEWTTVIHTWTSSYAGSAFLYFFATQAQSAFDIAEIQMEQKNFATAFTTSSRDEGALRFNNMLFPAEGSVVVDVTFHEDNDINGEQGADQYCFGNQIVYNLANCWWFHDTDFWWIRDSDNIQHSAYLSSPMIREERTHLVFVYDDSDGTMDIYKNGVLNSGGAKKTGMIGKLGSLGTNWTHSGHATGTTYKMCQTIHSLSFYNRSLSDIEAMKLAQSVLAIRDTNFIVPEVKEIGYKELTPLNYTSWTIGTQGSQGSFSRNGIDAENYIIKDVDPWGKRVPVWEARPEEESDPNGGWNHSSFSIDNTEMYRFSVWIRRTVLGNGSAYSGCHGYGSVDGVLLRSDGITNYTNPYFWSGGWGGFTLGEWIFIVGHIFPVGSGSGDFHEDSGLYNITGNQVAEIQNDFIWRTESTSANQRAYLYYSTDITTRQQFLYPRVDIVDGSEPTIDELIKGHDSRGFDEAVELSGGVVTIPLKLKSNLMESIVKINEI